MKTVSKRSLRPPASTRLQRGEDLALPTDTCLFPLSRRFGPPSLGPGGATKGHVLSWVPVSPYRICLEPPMKSFLGLPRLSALRLSSPLKCHFFSGVLIGSVVVLFIPHHPCPTDLQPSQVCFVAHLNFAFWRRNQLLLPCRSRRLGRTPRSSQIVRADPLRMSRSAILVS